MTILVTGASGMIGSQLVQGLLNAGYNVIGIDKTCQEKHEGNLHLYQADLGDKAALQSLMELHSIDRIIHLAALAHTFNEKDLSWDRYYHINVECAKNVFDLAGERQLLFVSTVDVIGFYDGKKPVTGETELHPISNYGKSKALAESECKKLKYFSIFRLSPVYTTRIKRDIQKRYYLKYPTIAYRVGKGTAFEILNINRAVNAMVDWCGTAPKNEVTILKDPQPMWTPDYIQTEKEAGRAKIVIWVPRWMVVLGYNTLKKLFGENEKTYLLNKLVYPIRSN